MFSSRFKLAWVLPFAVSRALAAEPAAENLFHVEQMNPDFDVKRMKVPGVKIREKGRLHDSSPMPLPGVRAGILEKAGLLDTVSRWDAYDRDSFYLNAAGLTPERFAAVYPKLPREKLELFHRYVQEHRKSVKAK